MVKRSFKIIISIFLVLIVVNTQCLFNMENKQNDKLTLKKIFKTKEYDQKYFGASKWDKNNHSFTMLKSSKKNKKIKELFRYEPDNKKFRKLISASNLILRNNKKKHLIIEGYDISPDGKLVLIFTSSKYVWRAKTRGNYWIFNLKSGKKSRIGKERPDSSMMFAKFSPDSTRVAYVSEKNIYVEDLISHKTIPLTKSGSNSIINGTFDWVYEEEFHMRDGFRWSPDGSHIAFWQFDISGVKDFYLIDNISDTYSKVIPIQYPKAGETNSSCRIGTVKSTGGEIKWVEFNGDPRMHYLARMEWAESDNELIIQRLNRLQNKNEVSIHNIETNKSRVIITETDSAWLEVVDKFSWIDKGKYLIWTSEKDGWRHLYKVSRDGKNSELITHGKFDVISLISLDKKKGIIYFTASPENPTRKYLYSVTTDKEHSITKITPANMRGTHNYNISKDSKTAIHYYSTINSPILIDLIKLPDHERELLLEENKDLRKKIKSFKFADVEFFRVKIENNCELDCWMIKPPDFKKDKKYPVIFYVYGEPWGQTVRDSWMGSNHMWYRLLASKGYVIVSIDNRGTPSPRGRKFRKVVYRKLGIITTKDQAEAAKKILKTFPFIDKEKVGVWGWSGGGSMTLNLMFQYPDIYKTGVSVAPVSDMRYYDSIYQERYMGLPSDNKAGYRDGSPITHVKNLKGKLLLIHGTGDDNVHYQNSEAVVDKLIEYNKQFSMMSYPNRRHGIRKGKSTRLHLFTLITEFFLKNLHP